MGCRSDYLAQSEKEREIQRAAKLLVYVSKAAGGDSAPWMTEQAGKYYADDDRVIPALCAAVGALTDEQREKIVYDAHDETARDLASWWERHRKADAARIAEENAANDEERVRRAALAKLTPEERAVLGVKK